MPNPIPIVFQNSNFVAVNKPAGCLSVRSREGKADPRPVLWDQLETQLGQPVLAIHRLDFEVSGIMLWALTPAAQSAGNIAFEKGLARKLYLALSEFNAPIDPDPDWQQWTSCLLRGKKRAYESAHGKKAITLAKFAGRSEQNFKWLLRPITGRSHQLRFEMTKHGFPILGDVLYGSKMPFNGSGIALQAAGLRIEDPGLLQKFELPDQLALSKEAQLFTDFELLDTAPIC